MKTLKPTTMDQINCIELDKEMSTNAQSIKLINALDSSKFNLMRITQSINFLNVDEIEASVNKDDEIVVYCTEYCCYKSVSLYHQLKSLGYKHVRRLAGGLKKWSEMGLPVEGQMVDYELAS